MEQTIQAGALMQFVGFIVVVVTGVIAVRRQIISERSKFASKEYVNKELKVVETEMGALKEDIRDNKEQNYREHDALKTEFTNTVKALDGKFDSVIRLLKDR